MTVYELIQRKNKILGQIEYLQQEVSSNNTGTLLLTDAGIFNIIESLKEYIESINASLKDAEAGGETNKLTIDEIIEHCKRKMDMCEKINSAEYYENADISKGFVKEYWEHRQVSEYLEELKQYRAVGTVDECSESVERRKQKKVKINHNGFVKERGKAQCPNCGLDISGIGKIGACFRCGQAILWED